MALISKTFFDLTKDDLKNISKIKELFEKNEEKPISKIYIIHMAICSLGHTLNKLDSEERQINYLSCLYYKTRLTILEERLEEIEE